ncbi:hypothetical protein HFD88_008454 [Aspergillus terreus]|nr:hypothetical protein HFD88_008454 [Aspergillus terreus]
MNFPPNTAQVVSVSEGASPRLSEAKPIPSAFGHQLRVKLAHVVQNPTDVQEFDSSAFRKGIASTAGRTIGYPSKFPQVYPTQK